MTGDLIDLVPVALAFLFGVMLTAEYYRGKRKPWHK
jgi:hypothetical protein